MTKTCPTCGRARTRSSEQNRRYWSLVNALADKPVQGVNYSPDSWHLYLKQRFLGSRDVTLPSGKTITIPQTTTSLDVAEFNDYMGRVEAWAAEHDVYLPE